MGSTVTTNKDVGAFYDAEKRVVYALFEETYESNVYPHSPDWSCISIGDIDQTMHQIFGRASSCEGGMLRSRTGNLSPEGYIGAWLAKLADPFAIADRTIHLSNGKSYLHAVNDENRQLLVDELNNIGLADKADQAGRGLPLEFGLVRDFGTLRALMNTRGKSEYGAITKLMPWRVFEQLPPRAERAPLLAYNPEKAGDYEIVYPAAVKIGADAMLRPSPDGEWVPAGWRYSIVGDFIRKQARYELDFPGSYKLRISHFRKVLAEAPSLPGDCVEVEYDPAVFKDQWQIKSLTSFAKEHGVDHLPTTPFTLSFPANKIPYHAESLKGVWKLPAEFVAKDVTTPQPTIARPMRRRKLGQPSLL